MRQPVDFDNFTDNYNDLLKAQTKFFSKNEEYFAKYKVDIVRDKIQSPIKSILEYGCGIGRNIPFLQKAFPRAIIFGSDISAASLDVARQLYPDVTFIQENKNDNFDNLFDLIFIAGVFHHIPVRERTEVMKDLSKRLTNNGRIIIFEHNPFNPVTRRIVNNCPYDKDAVLLPPSELKKLLTVANLTLESAAYCLFLPPRFKAVSWIENYLGWMPLGGQYWVQGRKC